MPQLDDALDALTRIGAPDELRRLADEGLANQPRPRANSHLHLPPNFSAFENVEQVLDLAAGEGVAVLGVSNYYDFGVYADFARGARRRGIFPLFGLEAICLIDDLRDAGVRINDPGNPGKMYLCGKGITRFASPPARAAQTLAAIRDGDAQRMREMIDRLATLFADAGVPVALDETAVIDGIVRRHGSPRETVTLQERHVAQAFQEALFAAVPPPHRADALTKVLGQGVSDTDPVKVQGEIRSRLMKAGRPAFVTERFIDFDQAVTLVLQLGGIPCYPTLADGAKPICQFEAPAAELVARLQQRRIHCAEFIPERNEPAILSEYVLAMRQAGIVVTGGTEHNTQDLLPIEPRCSGGAHPVPEEIREIFWEGACVTAAHQYLTAHGECGFVNADGEPDRQYADPHSRIDAFRRLGEAVIACSQQTAGA